MKKKIYFDYNSTSPARKEVIAAMMPYLDPEQGLFVCVQLMPVVRHHSLRLLLQLIIAHV